jgi:CDP-diacylglycerol--glycerol-3-phosphate 3-phosphatidyltransferase
VGHVQGRLRQVPIVNAANALTVVRIVLVPVFVVLVVISGMTDTWWRVAAAIAFGVASVTDFVDGWIARRYGLITSFGKVADPIADKALTGSALVLLSIYDALPWWITIVVLVREWGITLLRIWALRYGVIAASRGGKLKTVLQLAAIGWMLFPFPEPWSYAGLVLMYAALAVTVVTGVDYVMQANRLRREAGK